MTPVVRTERKMLLIGWLAGLATAGGIAGIALTLILTGVIFNISATQPHTPLFAWGVHATMKNSVARRSRGDVPRLPLTRDTLLAGAREYEAHCVVCHGGPGVARAPWVSGMLPTPPYLIDASSRWSHAELYNLVHDGVKMTGMPAWGEVESDRKVAEVVAFLEIMPKLTSDQFDRLRRRVHAELAASSPTVPAAGQPSGATP
ncbi:MAG: c-type cytochrome [Sphingomonas sp.]